MAPNRKRPHAAAGIASQGRTSKRRKAAEASTEKTKQMMNDESEDEETVATGLSTTHLDRNVRNTVQADDVQDMPLVAPGLRLWESFSASVAGTDLAALTKYDADIEHDSETVAIQRRYGMALKPIKVTEGPLAGNSVLVLQELKGFPFFELPAELRNKVYGYLLDEDQEVRISSYKRRGQPRRLVRFVHDSKSGRYMGQAPSASALLRVNRQMLAETAPIIYGSNTFSPQAMGDGLLFLDKLGSMRRYLREFRLSSQSYGFDSLRKTFRYLLDATDLQSIFVSHLVLCKENRWRRGLGSRGLASVSAPTLKAIQWRSRTYNDVATTNVLDIIKLGTGDVNRKCFECGRGKAEHCKGTICNVLCMDRGEHLEALQADIRAAVADALEIQEA